ncbi:hypothetical protein LWI28_011865 [Acer negundo]|uniref:Uncharacterized protein n=1 Tax=Acer negundo TaxID=4023 RepID=A0AAD5P5R7_ACENE|nr:hypothetical protein LWI28_011865 [Acer negundo]
MYCSKLIDVGLEGCGLGKSECLLKGPKVSLLDSTTENKKASDQVSHVDFKYAAKDYSPVCFGNGTSTVVQASGSGLEGKASTLVLNQDFEKEIIVPEMKKASWNLKEELTKVIKAEIVRRIKANAFINN